MKFLHGGAGTTALDGVDDIVLIFIPVVVGSYADEVEEWEELVDAVLPALFMRPIVNANRLMDSHRCTGKTPAFF